MRNPPVLIGPVPLLYVQSMTMDEGYQIQRIPDSKFSQALAPTKKSISIQALLVGQERLALKQGLEALAFTSRLLVASAARALSVTGIPVVCGLTISTDMQITSLQFTQSAGKLDALDVSITLVHVPRSSTAALLGALADVALAAGTALGAGSPVALGAAVAPSIPL